MFEVYKRVSVWNSLRYDREYDHELALNLLREEYQEWLDAENEVQELDALCDLVYVALGALWKQHVDHEDLQITGDIANDLLKQYVEVNLEPIYVLRGYLDVLAKEDNKQAQLIYTQLIAQLAFTQISGFGFEAEQVEAAMLIVCDANDTKSIQKTASDVKANKDKGVYFTAPEPKLQALLDSRVKH